MGILEKSMALVMLPLGILIVLEELGIVSLNILFDKALIGAVLMIVFQVINLILSKVQNNVLTFMTVITGLIFIIPASYYIVSFFFGLYTIPLFTMILAVMMSVEALYALH
jgi:hypothetical protein